MTLSTFLSKISKKLERSDDEFVNKFLADKEHSNLARRRVQLENLRRHRVNQLIAIFVSIFIVVYGTFYSIFGH